jgi:phosphonate transport system substrate-binding protein
MVVFAISLFTAGTLLAEDCPRGDLDFRFCDRDGDLVADPETDPSKWLNPDTLYFTYPSIDDSDVYKAGWSDFMEHMEKVTDKKVKYFIIQSNAVQIQAMRAERLHVAAFNTGSVPLAVNCAGFSPFTLMASPSGTYGYEMRIITYPGSGINKVEDLRGRKLTFTSPSSNSGFKAPYAILKAEFNMIPERDFEPISLVSITAQLLELPTKSMKLPQSAAQLWTG